MAKKKPKYNPSRREISEWKKSLSKRARKKYESFTSTKRKHEFMIRSMRAKAAYIAKQPTSPIKRQVVETESDVYEGIQAQIYARLPKPVADKLVEIMERYRNDVYGDYTDEYIWALNLNAISADFGKDMTTYMSKDDVIKLFEDLTEGDSQDYYIDRQELQDLYDEYYIDWYDKL